MAPLRVETPQRRTSDATPPGRWMSGRLAQAVTGCANSDMMCTLCDIPEATGWVQCHLCHWAAAVLVKFHFRCDDHSAAWERARQWAIRCGEAYATLASASVEAVRPEMRGEVGDQLWMVCMASRLLEPTASSLPMCVVGRCSALLSSVARRSSSRNAIILRCTAPRGLQPQLHGSMGVVNDLRVMAATWVTTLFKATPTQSMAC